MDDPDFILRPHGDAPLGALLLAPDTWRALTRVGALKPLKLGARGNGSMDEPLLGGEGAKLGNSPIQASDGTVRINLELLESLSDQQTRSLENAGCTRDDSFLRESSQAHPNVPELPKQKSLLKKKSRTAPALMPMHRLMQGSKSPGVRFPSIVLQASAGLAIYLLAGILIYLWKREEFTGNSTFALIDALYFCIVTMCTIGYGDITPVTPSAKLFSCFFVLVGFGFIDFLLSAMVVYALDRQEMLLMSTIDARARSYIVNSEKGRMRTRTKVALALSVVLVSLGAGTLAMHHHEKLCWLDSFYLACMSVTTVGYGDHAFKSSQGRLFAAVWLLVSTIAVARAFLFLAEAHIDRRHRLIAKWVLQKKLTVGDLVAADLNNDGFISKSEYVIYKLKEMGKIRESDVIAICHQFNELECGTFGKITLSRLLEEADPS